MSDQPQSEFRLRRGVVGRLFAGTPFQWVLTVVVVLHLLLIAIVSSFSSFATVAPAAAPGLVIWVIWLLGVFAVARTGSDGVHWRYYASHRYAWAEIEQLRFGARLTVAGRAAVGQALILVQVRGHEHLIAPAKDCGQPRLLEFGNALIALAAARQIPVSVDPSDQFWNGLDRG